MDWTWRLALRHLRARGARPAVAWMNRFAIFGVAVGVFAWTSVLSVMDGLQGEIRDRILNVRPHLLWEGRPEEGLGADARTRLEKALGSRLKGASFILQTEGLVEAPSLAQRGRIVGSGALLRGETGIHGVWVGRELAEYLHVSAGDVLKLRSAWSLESPPLERKVEGIFESGLPDFDRTGLRLPLADLESWLSLPGRVSRVEIFLNDPNFRVDEAAALAAKAIGRPVKTWRQLDAALWHSLRVERFIMSVVIGFVVILATLALHMSLSVRVAEKSREIGLLGALGADPRRVARIFLYEGALIGAIGSGVGLLAGRVFCWVLERKVSMPEFYYAATVPVNWRWPIAMGLGILAFAAAILASWGPARRARRTSIADALRS